jgi:hypothetical protein
MITQNTREREDIAKRGSEKVCEKSLQKETEVRI